MKVIVISGHAQNGKDTTASYMKEALESEGKKVLITHYADLLKYICKEFFGWNGVKDDEGRKLLQYVGTDVVRNKFPTFWTDFLIAVLYIFKNEWDYVLIPDTRFPNEIDGMFEYFDGYHVRVVRPGFSSPLTDEQQKHISETALDDATPDFTVNNNGTLDDLKETAIKTLRRILDDE